MRNKKKMFPHNLKKQSSQEGATLIEVLVSILILSIGLLSIAALMLKGLNANSGAYYRTQATFNAYDMSDRLRANRQNASDYNLTLAGSAPTGSGIAATEVADWLSLVGNLPAGDGSISCGSDNRCIIVVQWNNSKAGGEEAEQVIVRTQI